MKYTYYDSKGNVFYSLKDARRYLRETLREDPVRVQPFTLSNKYIKRVSAVKDKVKYYSL